MKLSDWLSPIKLNKNNLKFNAKKIFYLGLLTLVLGAVYFLGSKIDYGLIRNYIERAGVWGPAVYILLMLITFVFAPLSGTPLFFAGWVLFGQYFQIYNFIAAYMGMLINFSIARRWGRGVVIKFVGAKSMAQVDKFTENYGNRTLFFLRLTQGYIQDFVSYAFGLTKIKFSSYALISLFTPIPWLIFWQFYIVKRINNLSDLTVWFTVLTIPIFVVSIFVLSKIQKKK